MYDIREAEALLDPVARVYGINTRWLRVRTADYFGGLGFHGQTILEIGAGNGLYACALAALGAQRVVALEPEGDGSRRGVIERLRERAGELRLDNLEVYPVALQAYKAAPCTFDLIYMLAVINHLDEQAVQLLHYDSESRARYSQLLRPVYTWLRPGGRLVISDVSRAHPYRPLIRLGLLKRHPFQPAIEWEKHQRPDVWQQVLAQAGFVDIAVHWATNWRYPWLPKALVDNVIAAYLYASLFVLSARRPHD